MVLRQNTLFSVVVRTILRNQQLLLTVLYVLKYALSHEILQKVYIINGCIGNQGCSFLYDPLSHNILIDHDTPCPISFVREEYVHHNFIRKIIILSCKFRPIILSGQV